MIGIRFVLGMLVMLVSGAGALAAADRGRVYRRVEFLGLSFILGFGVIGLASVVVMLCGGKAGGYLPVLMAVAGCVLVMLNKPAFARPECSDGVTRGAWLLSAVALAVALLGALSSDVTGWDPDAMWTLKAKSIDRFGTFHNPDFTTSLRPHLQPRYPLLVPSVMAWVYTVTGSTAGRLVRLTMVVFFAASLTLMDTVLRQRVSPRLAAWLTALFAFTPALLINESGGVTTGYCDYPLAVFLLLAVYHSVQWLHAGQRRSVILGALSLAFLCQIKDEGMAIATVMASMLSLLGWKTSGRRGLLEGLAISVPAIILIVSWGIARHSLMPDPRLSLVTGLHPSRLPMIVAILGYMMLNVQWWSFSWPMVFAVLLLRRSRVNDAESLMPLIGVVVLLVYLVAWMVMPGATAIVVMTHNTNRLILHTMPLFFAWAGRQL